MADDHLISDDFEMLAMFRFELRRFLNFSACAAHDAGLTAQQHQALLAICASAGTEMLVGELAERLFLRPHSATELVNRLARLKLVERLHDSSDRRRVRVRISGHGKAVLATLAATHRTELRRLRPMLERLIERL